MKIFRKLIRRTMLLLVSILLALGVLGVLFFMLSPQIGATASGNRLVRVNASPNFSENEFRNTIPTTMGLSFKEIPGLMWKMIRGIEGAEPGREVTTSYFEPGTYATIPDSQTAITWFGHSSILLKMEGVTLLFDPVFSPRASMFSFMGPKRFQYDRHMQAEMLPEIDAVIISHDHYDHLDYPTLLQIKDQIGRFVVPLGVGAHLEKWGIPASQITELDWWEESSVAHLTLAFTPSRHFSGRGVTNRNSTLWGSWAILGTQERIYFSGDSGYTPDFAKIGERYGPFDLAFVECGQYNQLWAGIHMMPEESVQAAIDLQANVMIPIHWGKFALALHSWQDPVQRMTKEADRLQQPYLLPVVGQTLILGQDAPRVKWWEAYL